MASQDKFVKKATSGVTKDTVAIPKSTDTFAQNLLPDFSMDKALDIISTDDTVRSAIISIVDKAIESGFKIETGQKDNMDYTSFSKKVRFERYYYDLFTQLCSYQNAYTEIVRDGNDDVKFLNILEVSYTEPVKDDKDDVIGYKQTVTRTSDGKYPEWDEKEVSHIRLNRYDSSIWSGVDIKAVYKWVLIKQYIQKYIAWLFGTNQFRNIFSFKDSNETTVDGFLSFYKKGMDNLELPLPLEGEIDNIILREFSDGQNILSWVEKCDANINKLLQVPPIISGETGNSNRSSGDKQDQVMATRISSIQKQIKEAFENDLFPKMGFSNWKFIPNPILKNDIDKILQNAERMRNMGASEDNVKDYLKFEGFPITNMVFKDVETKKSEDMFDSRKRKGDETSKDVGTGEESTSRQDQFVAKGDRFNWEVELDE